MGGGRLFLGLDVGTQSTKALVLDDGLGRIVARAQQPYDLLPGLPPGHCEQHPDLWIAAVQKTAAMALSQVDKARIAGVGVSGQQHGCVLLDDQGSVLRPAKLWCDTATTQEAEELSAALSQRVPVGYTASKLLWHKRHEPSVWAKARAVLLPHDYVNFRLTGVRSMERGDASGTGLFDPVRRAFDPVALAAVDAGLSAMLPPLLPPGAPAGNLSAAGAALLGLRAGLPVAAGGGDNMMAAIGSGAAQSGVGVISLGTSGTVFVRSDVPVVDPAGLVAPFCSSDGAWLPLLCVMNLTGVTNAVCEITSLSHDELTARALAVGCGSDGLVWLPFLNGERVPDLPSAQGILLGMRGANLTPGHLYRAAIEGAACNLALGAARMRRLGVKLHGVRVCGGAAHNPLWLQTLADLLEAPVQATAEPEAAALGAAIAALWTVRRLAGEDLSAAEAAAPLVGAAGPVHEPSSQAAAQDLRDRYAAALRAQFPAAAASLLG